MTGFGMFQASVLGMQSQSRALSVIGGNVANVNTTGYKRSEAQFATLLSRTYAGSAGSEGTGPLSQQSDIGGVVTRIVARVGDQGELSATGRDLDVAIDGPGFFVLADAAGGQRLYGRNGRFGEIVGPAISVRGADGTPITTNARYLADQNGHLLQGWQAAADGSFASDAGSLAPVRTDASAFTSDVRATTTARLALNLSAGEAVGATEKFAFDVFDFDGSCADADRSLYQGRHQHLAARGDRCRRRPGDPGSGGAARVHRLRRAGRAGGVPGRGRSRRRRHILIHLRSLPMPPSSPAVSPSATSPPTATAPAFSKTSASTATATSSAISATERHGGIRRLPIADFANADGLVPLSGDVYQAGPQSGEAVFKVAGRNGAGAVLPSAIELSNVDLADQFSRMILTQNAYNSSATAFRTLDEVMQTARDLKR